MIDEDAHKLAFAVWSYLCRALTYDLYADPVQVIFRCTGVRHGDCPSTRTCFVSSTDCTHAITPDLYTNPLQVIFPSTIVC